MFNIKSVLLILFTLILVGCSATEEPFDEKVAQQKWTVNKQQLDKISAFKVNGSIAYFNDRTRSFGRFLIIQKSDKRYSIKITSPIGTSVLAVNVRPGKAEMVDRSGKTYVGDSIEELAHRMSSLNIPFDSLHNWLKGSSNNPSYDKLNASGQLVATKFIHRNVLWKLSIPEYMQVKYNNKAIFLPETIELSTQLERFRLTISNWTLK